MIPQHPTGTNVWPAGRCGKLVARLNQYDRDHFNRRVHQAKRDLTDTCHELELSGSMWKVALQCQALPGDGENCECEVVFTCLAGNLPDASVSVDLEFGDWSVQNYVLLPAAAYNGNRFPLRRIPYSPKLWFTGDIGPGKPIVVTDIPKLNERDGPSRIQERTGSMALPSIGFRSATNRVGIWLVTDQGNALGDYGIGIEENRDRCRAKLSINAPLVRELHSYRMCDMRAPSVDEPKDFHAGDEVKLSFRIHVFDAPDLQSLFDKYARIRKTAIAPRVDVLPYSACFSLLQEKFNRDNFVPEHGYYSVGLRENFLQDWQIGWTGGMISTYPLLFAGDDRTRENVVRNFDWLFPAGISPSGLFWDSGANGTEWHGGDIRKPHTANWHLIRKSADAVFYITKQFMLMEKLGIEVKPSWRAGTRRVCYSLAKVWRENRQFGQFVDSKTREIRVGGSTSAAIAPAALVLAARYFHDPGHLEVAEESAEHFYQEFTRRGLTCGGPGDALQNPDSESCAALVESYMALHDATGDMKWLERAGEAARQFSTWVVSYDFAFPPDSMFGKASIHTTGSVYANTQNKHSAPGICTLSGLGLFKLFRATADRFYLDLLWDIAHGLAQYLPHPLKPLGDAKPGHMCERVNMTDWEGPERIGETLRMTTWAETSLMLTTIEIPGIYVRPDMSMAIAFDHITAEIVADGPEIMEVRLVNPTKIPASVRIFCENSGEAGQPLSENYLHDCVIVDLRPGTEQTILFDKAK